MGNRILPMSHGRLRANVARLADTMQALADTMEAASRTAERALGLGERTARLRAANIVLARVRRLPS